MRCLLNKITFTLLIICKMRLVSLFIIIGLCLTTLESKAQSFYCELSYDYEISSNVDLTLSDYKVIDYLDSQLIISNLTPESCFFFKLPYEFVITFTMYDSSERTYVMQNKEIVSIFDTRDNKFIIVLDRKQKTKLKNEIKN